MAVGPDQNREPRVPSERQQLVEAMARCCLERGYPETSVAEVAAAARLEQEDFERHFADKEDCALAAVDSIVGLGMTKVTAVYSADRPERENAVHLLAALLELFAAHPALTQVAFIGSRHAMGAPSLARYESGVTVLAAMLDRLRSGSDGEGPPILSARAAIGGGEALVRREIAAGRIGELPRILPDLVYSAVVPFLGMSEAQRLARTGHELLEGTAWA